MGRAGGRGILGVSGEQVCRRTVSPNLYLVRPASPPLKPAFFCLELGYEAEGPIGTVADADAGGDGDFGRLDAVVVDGEGAGWVDDRHGVVCTGDAELAGEAAGPGDGGDGADEDAAGSAVGLGDEVEAFVHAVDEIDVGTAGRAVDDAGAGGDAAGGVGGFVVHSEVGFHFDDGGGVGSADQDFAEEGAGDGDGVAGVEGFGKNRVGVGRRQWVD